MNLSARHFAEPQLLDEIRAILSETQIEPRSLQLEITDRIAMASPSLTAALLSQLKRLDITTAIDDFGSGATSLADLRRFPWTLSRSSGPWSQTCSRIARVTMWSTSSLSLAAGGSWKSAPRGSRKPGTLKFSRISAVGSDRATFSPRRLPAMLPASSSASRDSALHPSMADFR